MPYNWLRVGVLAVLIGLDFSLSIYQRYFSDNQENISYTGHFSGFMMGLTLGTFVLKVSYFTDHVGSTPATVSFL